MIDSLILRIHGVKKYSTFIRHLDMLDVKGFQTETLKVKQSDIADLLDQGARSSKEVVEILRRNRQGDFLMKSKVAKQQNASNHYTFSYFINYSANHIELNFSVPKYTYGSNVIQFVDHFCDRYYNYQDCSHLPYNIERAYDRLADFLEQLFRVEFAGTRVNFHDVEVHRIDVCFNQLFPSKEEALRYLEYQKRLKKKYARDEQGVMRDYTTSLMYVTKRYSAKIYHKGTEYAKHDSKEHHKINKERNARYFKVEQYQAFADLMLRYELTIRTGMLNYLHKQHLFRRKCPYYQNYHAVYLKIENAKQKNDRIAKKAGTLEEKEKEAYLKAHPYEKIDKEERKVHRYVSSLITKRTYFMLLVPEEVADYNRQTVNYDCSYTLFSKGLLKQCIYKLVEFIDDFQIKELPDEEKVVKLVEAYNREHQRQLPADEMQWFYRKLKEIGSFKETARFYNLKRASMYRYKERFAKIAITEKNVIPVTEDAIPEANINLRSYHNVLTYTPHFLKGNNLFNL